MSDVPEECHDEIERLHAELLLHPAIARNTYGILEEATKLLRYYRQLHERSNSLAGLSISQIAGDCGDVFYEEGIANDVHPSDEETMKERYFDYFYRKLSPCRHWGLVVARLGQHGYVIERGYNVKRSSDALKEMRAQERRMMEGKGP